MLSPPAANTFRLTLFLPCTALITYVPALHNLLLSSSNLTIQYLCQAQLDSDATFSARFNTRITDRLTFKSNVQIAPGSMGSPDSSQVSLEQDYVGTDFTAQLKSINPSVLEGALTGMFIGSYLQSITPRLALGLEGVWQRPGLDSLPHAAVSYAARYKGDEWVGSLQLLTEGGLDGSYWRRLTDKVEAGVNINLQFAGLSGANAMMGGPKKEGLATLGAKYEFSRSIFRAQVDSQGKVGCLLEKMVAPLVRVTFAGEMDHAKVSYNSSTLCSLNSLTLYTELRKDRLGGVDRELERRAHGAARPDFSCLASVLDDERRHSALLTSIFTL